MVEPGPQTEISMMTKFTRFVKTSLFVANIFFAVLGALIVSFAMLLHLFTHFHEPPVVGSFALLTTMYVVGLGTMTIAAVGAYAARRERMAALIAFLVGMVLASLMLFRVGIPMVAVRPKMESVLDNAIRHLLPLDQADPQTRALAEEIQQTLRCCGAFGYSDWNLAIPESCVCDFVSEPQRSCLLVEAKVMGYITTKSIYRQPCFPLLSHYFIMVADIVIGTTFVLGALSLLGLILSALLIYQLRPVQDPLVQPVVRPGALMLMPPPPAYTPSRYPRRYHPNANMC
ncbi:tetraspanin-8-like isoform X2 [Stigmatopora nigra]